MTRGHWTNLASSLNFIQNIDRMMKATTHDHELYHHTTTRGQRVVMENTNRQPNLPLGEELTEAQGVEAVEQAQEARLAEAGRMAEAIEFVAALADRNRKNPPHHCGKQAIHNVLYKEEFYL
ncbi:hypothetical protein HAX54_006337 [Datura stramonium]|uniref:Uncharacterized protein n=1 Tax=Datura stramonium TaxID=4076 RepID=A0ABS8TA46_DATST|nr:hypothetical protein [Datura stramonium]